MSCLIIIPARGGSKGLPGKNIKPLLGKPLIGWTIETALKIQKKLNCRTIVSSDSIDIINVAKEFGAEIPFTRPLELAQDTSSSSDVVLHAIDFFERKKVFFDYVIMLETTSPLRDELDVLNAYKLLTQTNGAESVIGVCKVESANPVFQVALDENNFIQPFVNTDFKFYRRQDIKDLYFFEGSMYISTVYAFKKYKSFYHKNTLGYKMPKWKSFEIDDMEDFIIVEAILEKRIIGKFNK